MKVLLISGHGAGDPGACATIDGKQYREADLTIEVVDKLAPLLRQYGAAVTVYDKARDAYQDSKAGTLASRANFKAYDYVLEIHFNACVQDYKGNGVTTGTEIYWPSRGSASGAEDAILRHVCAQGFRNRGSRSMALAVINTAAAYGTKANLLEVCFIDDADDVRLYNQKKQQIAQAIADGVAQAFKLTKTSSEEDDMVRYNKVSELPKWAQADIQKLIDLGHLQGKDGGKLDLTEDMVRTLIICGRMQGVL